jgi:hypothetical protein
VTALGPAAIEALVVQLRVDRVGPGLARVALVPDFPQANVVGARQRAQGRCPAAEAVASSRKNSSVKRPGCISGHRRQPRNSRRQAIQRVPL